jgi:ABC-type nitrate/sulfonate/bicarbonate transport system substrate-binding protein
MKRQLARLSLSGLLLAALIATVATAASARPTHVARTSSHAAGPTVNIVEAGDQDFSSIDVLFWTDLLKKNGINVHFNLINDAATALRTVVSGQADMFIGSLPTAILAVANGGAGIHVIAANDQASDYVLVAQNDVTLQNASGKTLGIDTPGSAGQVAAELALKKLGVDPKSLHYVTIGGSSARTTAVLAGKIDIAPIHYPLALQAVATGKVHQLVNVGKEIGPYIQSGLIANDNFVKKNRGLAQRVVNAFINAERWANSNKFNYVKYAQQQKLTNDLTAQQMHQVWDFYRQYKFFGINGGICTSYVNDMVELNQELGSLPKDIPPASKYIDRTFVQAYLKAHRQKPSTC